MSKSVARIKHVPITVVEDGEEREKTVTVQKAGLGKWKQLSDTIRALKNLLPQLLEKRGVEDVDEFLEDLQPVDLLEYLPDLFEVAADEVVTLLAIGTDAEPDFICQHVGLDEAFDLFQAIAEVNGGERLSKNFPALRRILRPSAPTS